MIRLSRRAFRDLAVWMAGFGLLVGLLFPLFARAMGVPWSVAGAPSFVAACLAAGVTVGGVNFALARRVVGGPLRLLAQRMGTVERNLRRTGEGGGRCSPEACHVVADSDDELGDAARAFNTLVDTLAEAHAQEDMVARFTDVLTSQLDLDALARDALEQVVLSTDACAGALLLEAEGRLEVAASHALVGVAGIADGDALRLALRRQRRVEIDCPPDLEVQGLLLRLRPRQVILEPIVYKDHPLGALVLAHAQACGEAQRRRMDLLRPALGLALNNALAHDRLQRLAALDPLTGLFNRRFGLARLREEFGRSQRSGSPVGLVMFDIDHFKNVNDTWGHLVGDRVLTRVAHTARGILREGDVLLRYGGEEFLAILPAANRDDAQLVAERLRHAVECAAVQEGATEVRVTLSAGISAIPHAEVNSDAELVERADRALYRAKQEGRNRVALAA